MERFEHVQLQRLTKFCYCWRCRHTHFLHTNAVTSFGWDRSRQKHSLLLHTNITISSNTLRSNLKLQNWTSVTLMRIHWKHSGTTNCNNGTRTFRRARTTMSNGLGEEVKEVSTQSTTSPKGNAKKTSMKKKHSKSVCND